MIIRSGYSFRAAYGKLPQVISRLGEIACEEAALCDRNSTFGFTTWTKLCKDAGIRPVYGVELMVTPALGEKKPILDAWKFLAKDSLRPLHDLIGRATSNPGKDPSLTYSQALAQDGLIKISGERLLVDQLPQAPGGDFFVGLTPATPKGLIKRAQAKGLRLVAMSDNYYPREEDLETYRVAMGFRGGTQVYPRHIMDDDALRAWFIGEMGLDPQRVEEAIRCRAGILASCHATMRKASLLKPEAPRPLREMCEEGALAKGVDLSDTVYAERLDRELDLIEDKGFTPYFQILEDLMRYARSCQIVGPGRGSSAGSLVCYLLGITSVDPIPHNLIFERFIAPDRIDAADVDLDFSDERRHLVFEYAEKKYGKDRVARLGTVGLFRAQSALNQAGAVLKIPKWKLEKLDLIERQPGDVRVHDCLLDTLNETHQGHVLIKEHPELLQVTGMEGHPNVASQHAAGLLITDEPLAEYVAVDARTRAAWVDKKSAEELNLLKIDVLGLTQLSIFERTLELIGVAPRSDWLEALPLDDPAAFDVFNRHAYSGIFQFNGQALRGLAERVEITSLQDIIALGALSRPGPMAGGASQAWVRRKRREERVSALHPKLLEITSDTLGVIVYQEHIMQVCREIGGMSWEDMSAVRRAMGLRLGDEMFGRFWTIFCEGAMKNGLSADEARAVWVQMEGFASYAFNKSHSTAYGIVSYWCAYLKAHHPVAFSAATLDAEPEPSRQLSILRELREEGVDYVPIDPEKSIDKWAVAERDGKTILVGPLLSVKGIGPVKVREILDSRRTGAELKPSLLKQLQNAVTPLDDLFPIRAAIERAWPDLTKANIFSTPIDAVKIQPGETVGDVLFMGKIARMSIKDENSDDAVAKRNGRRLHGPDKSLNLFMEDDTGEIMGKVPRERFETLGRKLLDECKPGSILALKGDVPKTFRMISINNARILVASP